MHLLITRVQKVSKKIKMIPSSVAIYQPSHVMLYPIDTNLANPVLKTKTKVEEVLVSPGCRGVGERL